jgi:hypothetical protein
MERIPHQQQQGGNVEMVNNPEWETVCDVLLMQFFGFMIKSDVIKQVSIANIKMFLLVYQISRHINLKILYLLINTIGTTTTSLMINIFSIFCRNYISLPLHHLNHSVTIINNKSNGRSK